MTATIRRPPGHLTMTVRLPPTVSLAGDPCALAPGLTDLIDLAEQVAALVDRYRLLLADRPTVTAHLSQSQVELLELGRTLSHALGTLTYNAGCGQDTATPRAEAS